MCASDELSYHSKVMEWNKRTGWRWKRWTWESRESDVLLHPSWRSNQEKVGWMSCSSLMPSQNLLFILHDFHHPWSHDVSCLSSWCPDERWEMNMISLAWQELLISAPIARKALKGREVRTAAQAALLCDQLLLLLLAELISHASQWWGLISFFHGINQLHRFIRSVERCLLDKR